MITKVELVAMSEQFIEILAGKDGDYDLWKDQPYITISRTDDGEVEVLGHDTLELVRDDIVLSVKQRSGWTVFEVWDLKKKLQIPFKVNVVVEIPQEL